MPSFDIVCSKPDFSATEITFTAKSENGRAFLESMVGKGAIGATWPKSKAEDIMRFISQRGLALGW